MNVPSNIPNGIGVGGGAPQDILSVSLYLSQFAASLNNWAAQVANAVNWLLDKVGGYVTSGEVDIVPSNSTTYNHTSLLPEHGAERYGRLALAAYRQPGYAASLLHPANVSASRDQPGRNALLPHRVRYGFGNNL
jgi:hypothetical protein